MKKYIILSIIFHLITFCNLYSQVKIYGRIIDEKTNEPLRDVIVQVIEINKVTKSDINGNYQLNNLPNGKLTLEFSKIGYKKYNTTINSITDEQELNIKLSETIIETEEILVTGIFNSTQHENAVKIDVLNTNNLLKIATPNFIEKVTSIPGVDMISQGLGISKPVIRGFSMNDVVVLDNNVRIENYQFSEHHPFGLDEFGIEKIEIIKGPASLLYGSDAIGGVINLIREKPAPIGKILGDATIQYHTNTEGIVGNIGIKGSSDNFFGAVRIGGKSNADYLQPNGVFVPNSRFNEWSIKSNVGMFNKIGSFNLSYEYNLQKLGETLPSEEEVKERGRKNELWYGDVDNHIISSNGTLYLGKFMLNLITSYENVTRKEITNTTTPYIEMNLGTFYYNLKLNFPSSDRFEYLIGSQGKLQRHRNINDRPSKFLPDMNGGNIALYTLFQYNLINDLKLQAGIRYDYNKINTEALNINTPSYIPPISKIYNNISGSLGVVYNIDKLLFRFNLASAFRTPTLYELTSYGIHEEKFEIGNPNLTTLHAYETDFSVHYHNYNISIDIAGFYNKINNYIFIMPTNDTIPGGIKIYKYLQENSKFIGAEISFHIHPKYFSWLHFETHYSIVNAKMDNGENLPLIPAAKLSFELRAETNKLWNFYSPFIEINSLIAFSKDNVSPEETRTGGYTLINLATGISVPINNNNINFLLSVNNLFDRKYYDHLSTVKPIYYNMGRNITFTINTNFSLKD